MNLSVMNVVCYEQVCYERVCYEHGLLWRWFVMNGAVMNRSVMDVVCYERGLLWTGLLWLVCYERGLFWVVCYDWSDMNESVLKGNRKQYWMPVVVWVSVRGVQGYAKRGYRGHKRCPVMLKLRQARKHLSCCEYVPAQIPTKRNWYFIIIVP